MYKSNYAKLLKYNNPEIKHILYIYTELLKEFIIYYIKTNFQLLITPK